MVSKNYKSRGIYFDSLSEEQMDVYNFLGALSSSRILTPFITELILEFVKKKSRKDIKELTKKECTEIAKYYINAVNTEQPEQSTQLLVEAMQKMITQMNHGLSEHGNESCSINTEHISEDTTEYANNFNDVVKENNVSDDDIPKLSKEDMESIINW